MYVSPAKGNRELEDKAKNFVWLWFQDMVDERKASCRAVDGKPVMPAKDVRRATEKPFKTQYEKKTTTRETGSKDIDGNPVTETIPVLYTADGKETRAAESNEVGGASGPMEHKKGWAKADIEKRFRNRVMREVMAVDPASYHALEMDASGFNETYISKELNCGKDRTRSFLSKGYGVVSVLILLRKQLNWDIEVKKIA